MYVRLSSLLILLVTGCAHERLCPSPIGRITEDECAVYATQYAADKAALVGLGDAPIADQATADVARLTAACEEFNTCRRATSAYDNERAALHGRLKAAAVLAAAVPSDEGDPRDAALNAVRSTLGLRIESYIKPGDRVAYVPDVPWFGTRFLPPQPHDASTPALLDVWLRTRRAWGTKRAAGAWKPYATVILRGTFTPEDQVVLDWGVGKATCPIVGVQQLDAIAVACAADAVALTSRGAKVTVSVARDGQPPVELGTRRFTLKALAPRVLLPVPQMPPTLVFHPADDKLPTIDEQPSLVIALPIGTPTLSCSVDGQGLSAIEPSPRSAPLAVAWHNQKHVGWWRYDFALPFVAYGAPEGGEALAAWPKTGAWECAVRSGGQVLQTLRFNVDGEGRLAALPAQAKTARAAWLIEEKAAVSGR